MALTKVGPKFQITIPKVAREAIGVNIGDLMEAKVFRRTIVLRPKVVVDKTLSAALRSLTQRRWTNRKKNS